MKKHVSLSLILVFLSGCVSSQIKPPVPTSDKSRKIVVVPMEYPPLEVLNPSFKNNTPWNVSATMTWVPNQAIHTAGRVGVMFCGIFMLIDMSEAARRSAKIGGSIDDILYSKEAWVPTIIISQEAAEQITKEGKDTVILDRKIREIPGITKRERTLLGENWMAPIRSWYNQEISPFDYKVYKEGGVDAILEVGMSNYSLLTNQLLMQVMEKIVDPAGGRVLGRTRNYDLTTIADMDKLFDNDGKNFKELFAATANKLMIEDLRYLGLLAESR